MKRAIRNHIKGILTSWIRDPECAPSSAMALPEGVAAAEVCDALMSHHLQVMGSPYISEEDQSLRFREQMASSRERTAFLLLELERVLPAISWDACRPVVLKGGALALTSYRCPEQRWFLDLDILVPRGQVDEVCRRLESVGYTNFSANRDPLFYERHHLHRMMVGPQGSCIEVHWDLTLPASVYGFDVAGVFNRAREVNLGGQTMLAASPVDQILHGVYQNIADGFVDLKRVCDLGLLLKDLSEEDKLYLVKESRRTNMNVALWLTLHMVKGVVGIDTPGLDVGALAPGWATTRTLRGLDVEEGLFERRAEKVVGYASLLHFLMVPRQGEKLRESGRFVWPGEAELMNSGHHADALPGFFSRLRLSLFYLKTLLLLGGRATFALLKG